MLDQLVEELTIRPRSFLIGEVYPLTSECTDFLRRLHDPPHLVSGRFGLRRRLAGRPLPRADAADPDVPAAQHSSAPANEQVCQLMSAWYLIGADVGIDVLLLVDDHFTHGNLRDSAAFPTLQRNCAPDSAESVSTP